MGHGLKTACAALPKMVGAVLLLGSHAAWAACTDTTARVQATAGSACTATRPAYTEAINTIGATGAGSVLTVPGDVTASYTTGNVGGGGNCVAGAGGNGTANFLGNVTIREGGATNSYGLAIGAVNGLCAGVGHVTVDGDVTVAMLSGVNAPAAGGTRRGIMNNSAAGSLSIQGLTWIYATQNGNAAHRGISGEGGVVEYTDAVIDFWNFVNTGTNCIRSMAHGSGDTQCWIGGTSSVGMNVNRGTMAIDGKLTVQAKQNAVAVDISGTAGKIVMGADSILETADNDAVRFSGATPLDAFSAGPNLLINAGKDAFIWNAATATAIDLQDATVTAASNLWNVVNSGASVAFTADGGSYTGASANAGTLDVALKNSAVWHVAGDSTVTTATLTDAGTLDASGQNARTLTGNVANPSGRVDLSGDGVAAARQTGDTLTITGAYSGGGALTLDTALGDSSSPTDVLHVTGAITGATQVTINNLNGAGAATTGNGILVVRADSAHTGTFALAAPVGVNGFNYALVKAADNNWYLQAGSITGTGGNIGGAQAVPALDKMALTLLALMLAGMAGWGGIRKS